MVILIRAKLKPRLGLLVCQWYVGASWPGMVSFNDWQLADCQQWQWGDLATHLSSSMGIPALFIRQ